MASKFAADYGLTPDEWQRLVLDDWLGSSRAGRWASLTCGLAVPRQNGKNALLEIRELFGMVGLGEKILHTAHEVKTAQKHFRRLKYFFGQSANDPGALFPELNALVTQVRSVNGQEGIFLTNGGSVELVARSKNSGRGFTVDVLVMDEAQELSEDALEALMPTTSAAPQGNPQWIFTGTPPGPNASGEVFTRVRVEAQGKKPKRLSWHEWSVDGDVDLDDRSLWRATNPALETGRLQFDVIEGERARFSDDGFARERLGRWADADNAGTVVDLGKWASCLDAGSQIKGKGRFVLDVTPSRAWASIAVAGERADGVPHVEVTSRDGVFDHRAGVEWVIPRAVELKASIPGFVLTVVSGSAAEPLIPALTAAGVKVDYVKLSNVPAACGLFFDLIESGGLRHIGQDVLTDALKAARKNIDDGEGAWRWGRRKSSADITPLYAVTVALWALKNQPGPVEPSIYFL